MNVIANRSQSASRIAGDYYQHLVAWNETLEALRPGNDVLTITVEHPDAGNVDDIVVHRRTGPSTFIQVKHTVDARTPVGSKWLLETRTSNSKTLSILRKFYNSWTDLSQTYEHLELRLITDREIDHSDPIMSKIDRTTELLVPDIRHNRAASGRAQWTQHLGITEDELFRFLENLRFETGRPVRAEEQRAMTLMCAIGLNYDRQAIDAAIGLIRDWVQCRKRDLRPDTLHNYARERIGQRTEPGSVVIIDAIDYDSHPEDADEHICFVDDYLGDDASERRQLRDPTRWNRIGDEIKQAAQRLRILGVRRVIVRGAMRLPVWFAVGAAFRHVRGFEIAGVQNDMIWSSEDLRQIAEIQTSTTHIGDDSETAVVVSVATDATLAVHNYINATEIPIGNLTTILPADRPHPRIIIDGSTAAALAVAVRDAIRHLVETTSVSRIHLFIATPGALALLLGHRWNALPPTTIYEHLGVGNGYTPTFHITG